MGINKRRYYTLNKVRIFIAAITLLVAINDFVCSFTDVTIQTIAISDKMGYEGLKEYRFHLLMVCLQAVVYMSLVILHISRWKEKQFVVLFASLDFIILTFHLFRIINF